MIKKKKSSGFTIIQQSKTREYLECFTARPGFKLVQLDLSAIEPTVLAEGSKDPTLMELYGPGAKPNDVYLFNAANFPMFSKEVRQWYDPENPTKESLALAKKNCKRIRDINKTVHLAKQYLAGSKKVWQTLLQNEIEVTFEEADSVCKQWNELYGGIFKFSDKLLAEWEFNGGWIYNALYRPICVDERYTKDLVSRYCQSSGHDILLKFLELIEQRASSLKLEMYPWICDYHDETIYEVPEANVKRVVNLFEQSMIDLNTWLGGVIPVKGTPTVASTLADIKCE